jgi:hypothetical protein
MLRTSLLALLTCFSILSFAQDSTKKTKTKEIQAPAKVVQTLLKNHNDKNHPVKLDSAKKKHVAKPAVAPAKLVVAPVVVKKPDTAKHVVAPAVPKTLYLQYQAILPKFYHYQQPDLVDFWKNTADTLRSFRGKVKQANLKISAQAATVDSLKTQIAAKDEKLAEKVEQINFIGMTVSLGSYNLIVWGLIILLAIATFIVVARSASFRAEAHYRTKLYSELEDEFKGYKTKANEKEKKLARELQTERNKLDELLGRG